MNSIQSIGIANNYNVNFGHFTSRNIQNSSEILTKSGINPEQVVKQFVDKIEKKSKEPIQQKEIHNIFQYLSERKLKIQ